MSKINARTLEEMKKNKLIIILVILIILLMSFILILRYITIQQEYKNNLAYESLKTVEDVLNYYECKFISEKQGKLEDYYTDIELEFKHNLYDNENSNEKFFNNVINDVAKVLGYHNFRMIDEKKDIEIKVICENGEVSEIIINDISNYFIYMDSQIGLKNYVELPITEFQIESQVVMDLIQNNWSSEITIGTRESIFENYYDYFDEGIKTRTINRKIYNILFNKRYQGNIVNGIFPGVDPHTIEVKLGQPTFIDEELGVIGYKGKDIYVFFTEEEISVYRVSDIDIDDFFELADKFLNEELDLLQFMNELTYIWPDYTDYEYSEDYAFLSYPLKGIDIKLGYENTSAIVVYNNIKSNLTVVKKYLENPEFISNLKIDNLFEAEKRRIEEKNSLSIMCSEYIANLDEEEKNKIGESLKFDTYGELDSDANIIKLCFISKDGNYPNRELYDNVGSYLWLNSDIIIYSQAKNGIYLYNVTNGNKQNILRGEDGIYNLKSFENGILKYDDSELIIQY